MAANRSAGRAAEFVNVGRNVVAALKSGPVETGPTVPVATALQQYPFLQWQPRFFKEAPRSQACVCVALGSPKSVTISETSPSCNVHGNGTVMVS